MRKNNKPPRQPDPTPEPGADPEPTITPVEGMSMLEQYLAYVDEADDFDQLDLIGKNAEGEGMSSVDLETLAVAINNRVVYLSRGERSNATEQS